MTLISIRPVLSQTIYPLTFFLTYWHSLRRIFHFRFLRSSIQFSFICLHYPTSISSPSMSSLTNSQQLTYNKMVQTYQTKTVNNEPITFFLASVSLPIPPLTYLSNTISRKLSPKATYRVHCIYLKLRDHVVVKEYDKRYCHKKASISTLNNFIYSGMNIYVDANL